MSGGAGQRLREEGESQGTLCLSYPSSLGEMRRLKYMVCCAAKAKNVSNHVVGWNGDTGIEI
jgi:hypothetical protein